MTDAGTVDQARAALAAFEEGKETLAELETVFGAALQSGLLTPAVAMEVLGKPVAAGIVPVNTLMRLGLREASEGTVHRAPSDPESFEAKSTRLPHEAIATGQLLAGRYRLERKLGEGGMGVVYLASDQEVKGEIFAIKVLTPEIRERPDALELLREEVRKTRALAHPNIVGVYSLNVDRTDVFILMEYLEGKTLQELLDEDFGRGMRFDRAWPIIEDLGAALAYAHDHSVIHGDLKPANVFVTTSGKPKLLDFGIARAARGPRRVKDAAVLGALTPAYASCEMLEGGAPDTRDDIYAFACMVYEMLSGRHPFAASNAVQARDAGEKPIPITSITPRQNAALAQALAFDRAARSATVEMLLAGLAPGVDSGKRGVVLSKATWVAALLVASAVTVAYFVVDKFWLSKHVTAEQSAVSSGLAISDRSVAVLPFVDMSEKKDQEYFADGMAEEILDLLATIPAIKVIGRTSSFQFKGKSQDLRAIGSALGVSYVVEGSVRRSGERLRVTAQLVNAHDGSHLWSATYDEPVGDTLKVQDQIASNLARALQVTLGADYQSERPSFKSAEAYDFYLRGRHAFDREDKEGLESAAAYFQQVLELDPTSVPALEWLAAEQEETAAFGYVEPHEGYEAARRFAQRALALDPKSTNAYVTLSGVHLEYDWDWAAAERDAREALRLKPRNPVAIGNLGEVYEALGRWDEATRLFKAALTLDPLFTDWYAQLGNVQVATGRLSEAEASTRKQLQISPTRSEGHYDLGWIFLLQGNLQGALSEMQQERIDSSRDVGLAMVYHALGRRAESDAAIAQVVHEHARDDAWEIADAYAYRGELDQAFAWLDRAYSQKDPGLYLIKSDPFFKTLRGDPRYKAFLRKMNLPE